MNAASFSETFASTDESGRPKNPENHYHHREKLKFLKE
jgi:hypothetical protein